MCNNPSAPVDLLHTFQCDACRAHNRALAEQILSLADTPIATRSHYFAGRYENIYIPKQALAAISPLLDTALTQAARILEHDKQVLAIGFWLNIMRQGEVTLVHNHDDDDELLSGTYYIVVPDADSKLILHIENDRQAIEPEEGKFVFFHPATPHEVTENRSTEPRISIGFNIGLKKN